MWLNNLKIAVIEKDLEKVEKLLDEMPELHDVKDIEQALYLLHEATVQATLLKEHTADSMMRIKKNIDFLRATEHQSPNKLDIFS